MAIPSEIIENCWRNKYLIIPSSSLEDTVDVKIEEEKSEIQDEISQFSQVVSNLDNRMIMSIF